MANRTVKDAVTVKGTNPQYLIEKIIRTRIYDSRYWKEECFALSAELLVDKAMELRYIGGVYGGNIKPAPFLCLILKMLQIQPEKDIVVEFIKNEDFKYVRALGAYYMRLTGSSMDCYKYLEPLLNDYRKLRRQNRQGGYEMVHMDEYIDELLRDERLLDVILPRIQKRQALEEVEQLEPRISALEEDLEDMESEDEDEGEIRDVRMSPVRNERGAYRDWDRPRRSPSPRFRRSPPRMERIRRSPPRRRSRSRERQREHRHRNRSRERRHRSTSRERRSARDEERRKTKKGRREKEKTRGGGEDLDREIQEANELRAKLGMAPLR